jgi:hypothetical protein
MRALFPLTVLALLAGCGGGDTGPTVLENEAHRAELASTLKDQDRMFGVPAETIARANQFGFHAGDYVKDGNGFSANGQPITLSQSDAKSPNKGRFKAAGATPDHIDYIAFSLDLTDPQHADTAKQRFVDLLRAFLSQYQLDDAGALDAMVKAKPSEDAVARGVPHTVGAIVHVPTLVTTSKAGDGNRTITVTFTRSAITTPTFPDQGPDQGQADGNRA